MARLVAVAAVASSADVADAAVAAAVADVAAIVATADVARRLLPRLVWVARGKAAVLLDGIAKLLAARSADVAVVKRDCSKSHCLIYRVQPCLTMIQFGWLRET